MYTHVFENLVESQSLFNIRNGLEHTLVVLFNVLVQLVPLIDSLFQMPYILSVCLDQHSDAFFGNIKLDFLVLLSLILTKRSILELPESTAFIV